VSRQTQQHWGPQGAATSQPRRSRRRIALAITGVLIGLALVDAGGGAVVYGVLFIVAGAWYLSRPLRRRRRAQRRAHRRFSRQPDAALARADNPVALLRETTESYGGVFLGLGAEHREWIAADPEHAVMVLGPPRSGKTTAVVIPAVMSAPGAVVSTSTKLDVFGATAAHRSQSGQVWIFDPSGTGTVPPGARRLRWSPVIAGRSWDDTLTTAAAMVDAAKLGSGGDAEFWNERAGAMLAALLHAAVMDRRSIADVRGWVLRHDLDRPLAILQSHGVELAAEILEGLGRAGDRALSSVFATASSVLAAYNAEAALANSEQPNFDVHAFAASSDTVYITAPAHLQARLSPIVVGLLEEIRSAAYARARRPPVFWALDEVANIAPLKTLPAIVSEGGGQGLQAMACFQDLSQARARWGPAADGFLSLFGTKIVFAGIGDTATLRALSTSIGTWDRPQLAVTETWGRSKTWSEGFLASSISRTRGGSVTMTTQREAVLAEGDIANIPAGHALVVQARRWALITAEPYFASPCWRNVLAHSPPEILARPVEAH
jgi:type IV secretion system protein VirD4